MKTIVALIYVAFALIHQYRVTFDDDAGTVTNVHAGVL